MKYVAPDLRQWRCEPMHAWLTEYACAWNRKHAHKDEHRIRLAECRACPGVAGLHAQGAPPPRELSERIVSPRNGMAEARREPAEGQRVLARNLKRGKRASIGAFPRAAEGPKGGW